MAKDRNGSTSKEEIDDGNEDYKDRHKKSKRKKDVSSESSDDDRKHRSKTKKKSHRYDDSSDDDRKLRRTTKKRRSHRYDDSSSSYDSDSDSESGSESESLDLPVSEESEGERRRRKRRERESKERRREKKRKREKEERRKKKENDKKKKKKKKKKDENVGKKVAVTNSWGKYGIIREIDMWNKRPEFTAWLLEVKQVNLETLANWEEKQMFKEFMEDHNTATFPSKKFYDLDAYHCHQMEKEAKKGLKRAVNSERTVFDDEEQRRLELQRERNRQKEEEIEALKRSMQSGMAQAMKDQARLREEMAYQYKLGNFEAAAAIQRRLDPDVAM